MIWTWQAFQSGRIDAYRISLIASSVDKLRGDNHAIIELDHRVNSYAAEHTAAQLKGWLKRFVARNAPDQTAVNTEHQKRSVWVDHHDDGMSYLHAYLPTPDAILIDAGLTERAKQLPADDRTLDQKRADEFAAQMRGHVDGSSTAAARSSASPSPSPPSRA